MRLLLSVALFIFSALFVKPILAQDDILSESPSDDLSVITYNVEFKGFKTVTTPNGDKVLLPLVSYSYSDNNPAAPITIVRSENLVVPSPDAFDIVDVRVLKVKTFSGVSAPSPSLVKNDEIGSEDYIIDEEKYKSYKLDKWAELTYSGRTGNIHLAKLKFYPIRYNSEKQEFQIPQTIKITVKYKLPKNNNKNISIKNNYLINALNKNMAKAWADVDINKVQGGNFQNLDELSSGKWFKLSVNSEGIYKIDASMLSSRGATIKPEEVKTIKVFGNGGAPLSEAVEDALKNVMNEQEIIVRTKPNGELESIIFYAFGPSGWNLKNGKIKHYLNPFNQTISYLLTWGGSDGKRANPIVVDGQAANVPDSYTARVFFEEEMTNPFTEGTGRNWFGRSYFSTPFIENLNGLNRNGKVLFRTSVAHKSYDGSGTFVIQDNKKQILNLFLNRLTDRYEVASRNEAEVEISASNIASDNRMVLDYIYTCAAGASKGTAYFDFYEVHYPRELSPLNDEVSFVADLNLNGITEYKFNNFSTSEVLGFETSVSGSPKLLTNLSNTGSSFDFKTELSANRFKSFYISSKFKTPVIENVTLDNLRGKKENAQAIVLTHKSLLESANAFAKYRSEKSNMKVIVVTTEQIFNEFNAGSPDLAAIRDYLAYCYHNWDTKPEFLVIWGDGHYDYRNISVKTSNYVFPYESIDDDLDLSETQSYSSDDFYVWLDGHDNQPELSYGRITLENNDQGFRFLEKLKKYENESNKDAWRTNILLVADDGPTEKDDTDNATHTIDSEELSDILPNQLFQRKLYLVEYPTENIPNGRRKPKVAQELVNQLTTNGALIFNWYGHGNPRVLAHEQIFDREKTIPQLNNLDKLFFMTAATCDFSRYDKDGVRCGAELLVDSKIGGAIAVLGATRVVYAGENQALNEKFYKCLFTPIDNKGTLPTLGQAFNLTKQEFNNQNAMKYFILGDPTMKLLYPENNVSIDRINGLDIIADTIELKGLSSVKLEARVLKQDKTIDESFNGTALITLCDGDEDIEMRDENGAYFRFDKFGGILNKSMAQVKNGVINSEFIIPKDISFSDLMARLYVYANSDDNRSAKGFNDHIKVYGVDGTGIADIEPPSIAIFMDSRNFRPKDKVRQVPLLIVDLNDNSGINSTGLGIGHRIEAWIDNNTNSIDLTSDFQTSLENPKGGTCTKLMFGLSAGLHKIKVRAWDVYNNYNETETYFVIPEEGDNDIYSAVTIPNPFYNSCVINIEHNATPPINYSIDILNSAGQLIRKLEGTTNDLHTASIPWDGQDNEGNAIPIGSCYYNAKFIYGNSQEIQKSGLLGVKIK